MIWDGTCNDMVDKGYADRIWKVTDLEQTRIVNKANKN